MEPEDIRTRIFKDMRPGDTPKRWGPEDIRAFHDMYPGYTPANLDTHNVREDLDCMLVHQDHPVVGLLHQNADITTMYIRLQERVDGEWHRICEMPFIWCCETIYSALGGTGMNTLLQ